MWANMWFCGKTKGSHCIWCGFLKSHLHFVLYCITALPEARFSDTPLFLGVDRFDNARHAGVMLYTQHNTVFFSPHHLSDAFFSFTLSVDFRRRSSGRDFRNPLSPLSYEKKKSFHEIKRRREKFWSLQPRGSRCKHPRRRYTSKPLIKGQFHSCKNARLKCEEYVQRTAKLQIWHQNFWVRALFSDGAYLIKCASLPSIHWNSSPFSLVCEWGILHIHGDHSGDSLEFA